MKKAILISVFIFSWFLSLNTLFAGDTSINRDFSKEKKSRVSLLKFGLGISYLNTKQYTPKVRFHVGLAPTIPLRKEFYLKPEIALSLKGGNVGYDDSFFDGHVSYRITYLEFPLVIGVKPTERFSFEFGGYGALLLSGNFKFDGEFFSGYGSFGKGEINSFDYGLTGGIVLTSKRMNIGIRYFLGLQEVATGSSAEVFLDNAVNQTIQLTFQRNRNRERIRDRWK